MSSGLDTKVRGGQRERGLERGPRARATQPSAPGGRPLSPVRPVLATGRRLERGCAAAPQGRGRVRAERPVGERPLELTDRAIALIGLTLLTLMVTGVVVIVSSFLAISDAPADGPVSTAVLGVASR